MAVVAPPAEDSGHRAAAAAPSPVTPQSRTVSESAAAPSPERAQADTAVAYVASPVAAREPVNLLAPLGSATRHLPSALRVAQVVNLVVFLALLYFGFAVMDEAARYTNITSFLVWVVWWPFIVVSAFFAARLWCTMCHLRLTADAFDRFGLKLKVPRVVKKYGTTIPITATLGIFIVHSSVVSYEIHHLAAYTAIFLAALMVYAAVIGLVFEKHSFCKYFCPLIGVMGNYTRFSPTELRSADLDQCKRCKDKECIKNCQNRLYMGTMDDEQGESCLLCMRCVKHCPHDNIRFSFRPFLRGLWQSPKRTVAGTFAVIVLLGVVAGEVGEEWALVDGWLLAVPTAIANLVGFETILPVSTGSSYLIWEALWIFILMPLLDSRSVRRPRLPSLEEAQPARVHADLCPGVRPTDPEPAPREAGHGVPRPHRSLAGGDLRSRRALHGGRHRGRDSRRTSGAHLITHSLGLDHRLARGGLWAAGWSVRDMEDLAGELRRRPRGRPEDGDPLLARPHRPRDHLSAHHLFLAHQRTWRVTRDEGYA